MGEQQVGILVLAEQRVASGGGVFIVPVAVNRSLDAHAHLVQLLHEPLMAFDGRRGAGQSVHLDDFASGPHQEARISGRLHADALIVDTLVSGITVAMNVAVKGHHRDAASVHLLYYRRDGIRLVGSHDDDVEAVVRKIADVGNLFVVVVLGRAYLHPGIGVEYHFAVYLLVAFVPPVVAAALRNADFVDTSFLTACK